ncbi:MAG: hydrogenase nickel incorporation protein HypB [Chitinivibrionales bacterium]|nr:hydrogenase nickel incorporation protein HypB [Chitinivibrionales bacterium]
MCDTCGCGNPTLTGHHHHHTQSEHMHAHSHEHSKKVEIGQSVLAKNNAFAQQNRDFFASKGLLVLNIISSPGSGKTTLLQRMAEKYGGKMAVVVGDLQTRRDADRIVEAGSKAYQIETGGACHLDAHSVGHAIEHLDLEGVEILVIENVGNLVCPAAYDLGEQLKVAILSTPEGDDKVLKYPSIFSRISVLLINKVDLLEFLDFDPQKAVDECSSLNEHFEVCNVSAKTGAGLADFFAMLDAKVAARKS